jgi:hypothetical protein
MMGKYGNIKRRTADGILHDSIKEARRWNELKLLERAGVITDLHRQVKFVLIPKLEETYERISQKTGKRLKDGVRTLEHECAYVADFVYQDAKTGELFVEDTKGVKTKDYIIKRKLMLWLYSIRIKEL